MSNREDQQAFPQPAQWNPDGSGYHSGNDGMTLRDYFAGQALPDLIGDDKYMERKCTATITAEGRQFTKTLNETNADCIAKQAYFLADAMITARAVIHE